MPSSWHSLFAIAIYNIETTRANRRKKNFVCGGIYAAIIVGFCVGISLHYSLYIRKWLVLMQTQFCVSVVYCIYMIIQEMIMKKNEYIKPELSVYQMETQAILAGSYIEKAAEEDYSEESGSDYRDASDNIWAD